MKKWKNFLLRLPVYLVLVAMVGLGLWKFYEENGLPQQLQEVIPTEAPIVPSGVPPEELVDNVIQMGETFSITGLTFTGHLECKITAARMVTSQDDCPRAWFDGNACLYVYADDGGAFYYDQWFTTGGALEQGAQLARLDVEITNVDALAKVMVGNPTDQKNVDAFFLEDDLFVHNFLLHMTDLGDMDQYKNTPLLHVIGHSECGKYASENIPETMGNEVLALQISQGETLQLSMIFAIDTRIGGKARDPAYLFGMLVGDSLTPFTYIDLNLEKTRLEKIHRCRTLQGTAQ